LHRKSVTFKNVDFLSEFVVIETHVYVKASSAIPRQRAQVLLELNKRIPLRRDISKDLSCK